MGWNQVKSHRQHSPRHLCWFRAVVTKLCSALCSVTEELPCCFANKYLPCRPNCRTFCVGSYKLSSTLYYHHLSDVPSPHYPVIYPVWPQQNYPAAINASLNRQSISTIQHHPGLASMLPGWPSESHLRGTHLPLATAAGVSLTNNAKKIYSSKVQLGKKCYQCPPFILAALYNAFSTEIEGLVLRIFYRGLH